MNTRLQDQKNLLDTVCQLEGENSIGCRMEWEAYEELCKAYEKRNEPKEITDEDILRA